MVICVILIYILGGEYIDWLDSEDASDLDLEQLYILDTLYKSFKSNLNEKSDMYMWFIKYSILNYEFIKNEQCSTYYKFKDTYKILCTVKYNNQCHSNHYLDSVQIDRYLRKENVRFNFLYALFLDIYTSRSLDFPICEDI